MTLLATVTVYLGLSTSDLFALKRKCDEFEGKFFVTKSYYKCEVNDGKNILWKPK